ncbi:hypothetical protein FGLOB1_10137 [Fusarium globosum]|uniref:Uncharacterized protein n=1 Tax=Fusarium globosum TaxID=78864 RepID=A0A8H5XXE8_9HYPO|nr:hypothetical protein FGLOB1_10137 [Fusarium globosum]
MGPGTGENETLGSNSEAPRPEQILVDIRDIVQRLERQFAQVFAAWERMVTTLENIASSVQPPFNNAGRILALIAIPTFFKKRIIALCNFMKRWSKKCLEVKLDQPKPEGPWPSCRRAFAKLISGIDFIMTPFQVTTDDEELAKDRQIQIDQLRATLAQKWLEINAFHLHHTL